MQAHALPTNRNPVFLRLASSAHVHASANWSFRVSILQPWIVGQFAVGARHGVPLHQESTPIALRSVTYAFWPINPMDSCQTSCDWAFSCKNLVLRRAFCHHRLVFSYT